jgi:hypothetical protein
MYLFIQSYPLSPRVFHFVELIHEPVMLCTAHILIASNCSDEGRIGKDLEGNDCFMTQGFFWEYRVRIYGVPTDIRNKHCLNISLKRYP